MSLTGYISSQTYKRERGFHNNVDPFIHEIDGDDVFCSIIDRNIIDDLFQGCVLQLASVMGFDGMTQTHLAHSTQSGKMCH